MKYIFEVIILETRVAVIGIIVKNKESVEKLNQTLSEFGEYIIGRMGVPYREKNISIIMIAINAPQDYISEITGKIGRLDGVNVKTSYANVK
jgi:putative iron-only hydrogenase system regulator